MKKLWIILVVLLLLTVFYSSGFQKEDFGQKRERILNELSVAIDEAAIEGKYKCCIDPPCTMCYLGNWVWDDGTCDCDGMILKGEWNNVCPQCIKGIEEGRCTSSLIDTGCTVHGDGK